MNINNLENEEWRQIRGFEDHYKISNKGRVYSLINNKLLTLNPVRDGKCYVKLSLPAEKMDKWGQKRVIKIPKGYEVGFLVCNTFRHEARINEKKVKHINGVKNDNREENLKWA